MTDATALDRPMVRAAVCSVLVLLGACSTDLKLDPNDNVEPAAHIDQPLDGDTFTTEDAVDLQGTVADGDGVDDLVTVVWTSSLDGVLGDADTSAPDPRGVTRVTAVLSEGVHAITLTATDSAGLQALDSVTVTVSVPADESYAKVTRVVKAAAGAEVKELRCLPRLDSVLNAMTSLGGGYAEAVELVRKADRAEALAGKLVIDAIPREFGKRIWVEPRPSPISDHSSCVLSSFRNSVERSAFSSSVVSRMTLRSTAERSISEVMSATMSRNSSSSRRDRSMRSA